MFSTDEIEDKRGSVYSAKSHGRDLKVNYIKKGINCNYVDFFWDEIMTYLKIERSV